MIYLSFARCIGATALLPLLIAGSASGDDFDGTVDSGASLATIAGSVLIQNTGVLIGDYDAATNTGGTKTIPGLFGGSGNNSIDIDLDGAITTDLNTNPTGSMSIAVDFKTFSIDINGLELDVLGGESGAAQPSVTMLFSTFHTTAPSMIYPGGIPIEIPIGEGSSVDEVLITQTGAGIGVLTATSDPDVFEFTMAVPAQMAVSFTLGIDGVDTPTDGLDPIDIVMPLSGTIEQLGNGDVVLTMSVDPQQSVEETLITDVTTPEIPFELPTLGSDTAGVLITLTPDTIGVDVSYAWSLTITGTPSACAADITGDGSLDIFDVLGFIAAFNVADPVADFNSDGNFDIFDLFEFIDAFNAGCL
jgi:hypothetical protein